MSKKFSWNHLPRPIIALSPMADMTDSAFCRVVRKVTQEFIPLRPMRPLIPIVFREMVSAEAVVRGNDKTLNMTDIHPDERPLVQQLFGADPKVMSEAARIIAEQHHPEAFDINMGCPVYKIVHNFNGAALMREPQRASEIVRAIKSAVDVPVSVKIRLGWSDPTECITFAKVLEDAGADLLTVHGRTKCQGYAGKADWDMIRRVKEAISIPVLCNGDIHKAELMPKALEVSKADGVLIARGALGNPWIFKQMNEILGSRTLLRQRRIRLGRKGASETISIEERVRVIKLHAALHVEQYGRRGIITFRKHLTWYFKGLPDAKRYHEQLHRVNTIEELKTLLDEIQATHVIAIHPAVPEGEAIFTSRHCEDERSEDEAIYSKREDCFAPVGRSQ